MALCKLLLIKQLLELVRFDFELLLVAGKILGGKMTLFDFLAHHAPLPVCNK